MIKVGVVGYGYWGPNLVRNFAASDRTLLAGVSDLRSERLNVVQRQYPAAKTTTDYRELLADPNIDAIAVATPVRYHFDIALAALQAGKHVLVEKPMAETAEQCQRLIDEAAKRNLVLMVDHTFIYTPAIRKIRDIVGSGDLGDVYYYDSVRVNLGLFQHDVNVLWDLAVHDLSILEYVIDQVPVAVSATGIAHVPGNPENLANLTLFFASNTVAHINVNWLAPVKVRQTLIGGSKKMIVYNELEPSEKIKVYDKGVDIVASGDDQMRQVIGGYRTGDMLSPQIDTSEALAIEARHFADCIEQGKPPLTGGQMGLNVVKVLEAASKSMALRGQCIEIA